MPLEFAASTSHLLAALAQPAGRQVTLRNLETKDVRGNVQAAIIRDDAGLPPTPQLLVAAFGSEPTWTSVSLSIGTLSANSIKTQRSYILPDESEVAVLETNWLVRFDVTLTGPRQVIEDGFDKGSADVVVPIQMWGRTWSKRKWDSFEVATVGSPVFASDASYLNASE